MYLAIQIAIGIWFGGLFLFGTAMIGFKLKEKIERNRRYGLRWYYCIIAVVLLMSSSAFANETEANCRMLEEANRNPQYAMANLSAANKVKRRMYVAWYNSNCKRRK